MRTIKRQLSDENRQLSNMYRLIDDYEGTDDPRRKTNLLSRARRIAKQWNMQITKDGDRLKIEKTTNKNG